MAWTTEDKFILKILFAPEKVKSIPLEEGAGTATADPDLNWSVLLEKAQREGVSAVLFHNITKHHLENLVPQESYKNLSNQYYTNLKRNLSIIGELREVLATLQEAAIPCIVLKGIALAERVYPNLAMRGMSDVDLMVRKEDLFRVDDRLSSLGYLSRDSSVAKAILNPAGYLASLEYQKNDPSPLNLHLHWHPVNTSVPATMFAEQIDLNQLWEKAAMTQVADSQALMLCPEHMIIYLSEHALRIGHSFDRLILVCDIFFVIRAFESSLDWDFIVAESRRFNLSRFVYHSLSIVEHYTALGIPDDCIARLKPPDISWGEKFFLSLQRDNRRIRGSSYLVYLAMNRGVLAKIGFIARTFFPPRQILLQRRHGKNHESAKSYYIDRVREVFSQIFKLFTQDRMKITK